MPNPVITNLDVGSVILRNVEFDDGLLTFAGAATALEGTILARDSVSLKFVPYAIGGVTNENGIPKAVLTYPVTAAGAGDESIRAATKGVFRKERLVVNADGDGSNLTDAIYDELRDYGLVSVGVQELNILDNL